MTGLASTGDRIMVHMGDCGPGCWSMATLTGVIALNMIRGFAGSSNAFMAKGTGTSDLVMVHFDYSGPS